MSFDSIFNMLLIVLGFGFLIGIHEWGHFIAAKWSGIRTNAFAIGMGPQVFSYRKGIGFCYKSTTPKVVAKFGKDAPEMTDSELKEHGLSETEYSLRLLPIGGFVSMLGQEDGKPDSISEDLRSYSKCPIGKRMVVVSAGVVMNLLFAGFLFLMCFQIGVNFEAPILGLIVPGSPASEAIALDEGSHLQPGDTVISVDGKPAKTFTDIQIASAMAKPGVPVELVIKRDGLVELLSYSIAPASVTQEGLLELGLYPASSLKLRTGESSESVLAAVHSTETLTGIQAGMRLTTANGQPVEVWSQFRSVVQESDGKPVQTEWVGLTGTLNVEIPVDPVLSVLRIADIPASAPQNYDQGLLGLSPLSEIGSILSDSPNNSILQIGDIVLKVASIEAPRMGQLRNLLARTPDGKVSITVLRDSKEVELQASIRNGLLGVFLENALDVPRIAQPISYTLVNNKEVATPIADVQLVAGSEILSIQGRPVSNWEEIRNAFIASGDSAELELRSSLSGKATTKITIAISDKEHDALSALGWYSPLPMQMFDPIYVTRSSSGNPIKALTMGFDETVNMVTMTYLTIDRLLRRSVGVDQLRGPIGIVHVGAKIADRGLSYLFFFLAIISVNLAVLNFLPLPIVDGGLFLYLIYEKLFKKPPSIGFQNAAAVFGLGLIAMLFVVTFYNDIMRIVG